VRQIADDFVPVAHGDGQRGEQRGQRQSDEPWRKEKREAAYDSIEQPIGIDGLHADVQRIPGKQAPLALSPAG